MSSLRVGLSSSNSNRPQEALGIKGLKSTVSAKNKLQPGVGQVIQENRKPSLPALSIGAFEGPICASSSPRTAEKATQDVIRTSLSLAPSPARVAVPGESLEEVEQSAEYWRQLHESMEVSLDEAVRSNERAVSLLELHTNKLNESIGRLQELREVCEEMGLDAEAMEAEDDGAEYTGAIYRSVFEEED